MSDNNYPVDSRIEKGVVDDDFIDRMLDAISAAGGFGEEAL